MKKYHIPTWQGILAILFVAAFLGGGIIWTTESVSSQIVGNSKAIVNSVKNVEKKVVTTIVEVFDDPEPLPPPPPPPDWDLIKNKGCVADGVLNGYGGNNKRVIEVINRSECEYLHRSIETWLEAPDFDDIKKNKKKITKEDLVFGMFIAEAIDTKVDYFYPAEDRDFDFSKMCKEGTKNIWGEHTCRPSLARSEYRKYVQFISEQAMDIGVQSFMFGQIYYQDSQSEPWAGHVIEKMKEYAEFRGIKILVGAQTNDIEDEAYLRLFDYIEGGVGLHASGETEDGPCFSRWDGWCWALLWHEKYKSKANNVLIHLDWSGHKGDDMATFALMSKYLRDCSLRRLHKKFTSQDIGFLMPILTPLPKDNGGCHGKSRKFYSPDDKYSCKDEGVVNDILK
ncbi:MAG: hypothetical protein U9O20_04940 [Patescibacteria group bacterium]|nr:hypothetical protein [Patescibacteria group bacterium]